ncbi:hypothetical protein [Scytonema sp. NUACC26]|uniref:hypothetical protein n=1 Tax=Scytonema sp. NUACC26 TaxID=3140176 RepID=UPI0034DC1AEB
MKRVIKFRHDKFAGIKLESIDVKDEALSTEFLHCNIGWSDNTSFAKQVFLAPNVVLICDQRGQEKQMQRTLVVNTKIETVTIYGDCLVCFFDGANHYGFDAKEFDELYPLFEAMKG